MSTFSAQHYNAVARVLHNRLVQARENREGAVQAKHNWDEYSYWTGVLDSVVSMRAAFKLEFERDSIRFDSVKFNEAVENGNYTP